MTITRLKPRVSKGTHDFIERNNIDILSRNDLKKNEKKNNKCKEIMAN